jgi:RNA polymerase sigma factor (sigma-70 family)
VTGAHVVVEPARRLAPRVLVHLVRRHGGFDDCEDAVQDALAAAAAQWPHQGVPQHPLGWLITVATRRLTDARRRDAARQHRESTLAARASSDELLVPGPDEDVPAERDDTLTLLFLCCHPALSRSSQTALTLRAVGGLTTTEIARAFLVPVATMSQRISRAKARLRETGTGFELPPSHDRGGRLGAVLQVLYLVFNEGYTASSGPALSRPELTGEAIRLTRDLHRVLPDDGEVAGLLALMLLTEARRPARTGPDGILVPLTEQDRSRWDRELIREGVALTERTLARATIGPYQLQAAIAAVHGEATGPHDTDWPQIVGLYRLLEQMWPNPMVTLNHAAAVAMAQGPAAGLDLLATLDTDQRLVNHHRFHAVRGHLLEMAGDHAAARTSYQRAMRLTTSSPERRYLRAREQQSGADATRHIRHRGAAGEALEHRH